MPEPISVDPAQFFDFIGGSGLKVIFLSVHPAHTFNRALCEQLATESEAIACGTVGLPDLVAGCGPAVPFLAQGFRGCGPSWAVGVLPGYCLFRGTEMLAWDAGLPAVEDVGDVFRGALLGVIWSAVTNDMTFVTRGVQFAADHVIARRVVVRFRSAAAERHTHRRPTGQSSTSHRSSYIDDLAWAYQVLGVPSTATDREVHRAWRQRRIENHPDHARADVADFDRRTRISADINRARDIIVSYRSGSAWSSANASAA